MPTTDALLPLLQVRLILFGGAASHHFLKAKIACFLPLLQVQLLSAC